MSSPLVLFADAATLLAGPTAGNGDNAAKVYFVQIAYLIASALFILGLKGLTAPDKARNGMRLAAAGMLAAVIGTLLHHDIVSFTWIIIGLIVGGGIGAAISIWMPMTAVPQRTAISHAFGALAATLVGIEHYQHTLATAGFIPRTEMAALGFEVMFGSLTITGSFMAFGKLQGFVPSAPITYKFQNHSNIGLFFIAVCLFVALVAVPSDSGVHVFLFYLMVAIGLAVGVLIVLPIGGADMPVVISLLNSYAGLASSATGFALQNNVLIIAGALDGASGFILSILMSRAMNRSFANVLFGAFGSAGAAGGAAESLEGKIVRSITVDDAAIQLAYARSVIVIPGYGMAVAHAQHEVRELAEQIEQRGGEVKFAIHPVAGRMPGHMNVLLAEANVPYDKLFEMDDINGEFNHTDVALVIGANDVVNPAARTDPSSPIHGMPILNADQAKNIIVLKRSMNPGFAGIENALFYDPKCAILFGDAKSSLTKLVGAVKAA
ncbi:MAG TPA: NAD(P)(+) transhydrogenase (Re/Si-specific) subunit beta [Pirellulales bacterium]|nr:NAD(P)(+) transhydrogenase (Re/Si-specific) subunit beta [Pirellulales bacterium]